MSLLQNIVATKRKEVANHKELRPLSELTRMPFFEKDCKSIKDAVLNGSGIIAEYKVKSPSAGNIQNLPLEEVLNLYIREAVSGYSILTDHEYFGGSLELMKMAKQLSNGPVLRKDFVIDEYQVFEAKAFGADAILLIAEILDEYHAKFLTTIAHSLGLEVIMEFHTHHEFHKINDEVDIIGVNNRNLDSLETTLQSSVELLKYLPYEKVKISESGIRTPQDLQMLYELGYDGCLIGESVLKNSSLLSDLSDTARKIKMVEV